MFQSLIFMKHRLRQQPKGRENQLTKTLAQERKNTEASPTLEFLFLFSYFPFAATKVQVIFYFIIAMHFTVLSLYLFPNLQFFLYSLTHLSSTTFIFSLSLLPSMCILLLQISFHFPFTLSLLLSSLTLVYSTIFCLHSPFLRTPCPLISHLNCSSSPRFQKISFYFSAFLCSHSFLFSEHSIFKNILWPAPILRNVLSIAI